MSTRREFIRNCGLLTAGTAVGGIGALDAFASPMPAADFAAAAKAAEPLRGIKFPIRDLEAVVYEDVSRLTSNIEASVESHIMGFKCEQSRKSMKKVEVKV